MPNNTLIRKKTWASLRHWYQSPLGQQLYESEAAVVAKEIDSCFGFCMLQIGQVLKSSLIKNARVHQQCIIACHQSDQQTLLDADLLSNFEQLAIKSNSIDAVVLFHSLEFSDYPHEILREVERILIAEGKLIIVAFNPYSLFSLWRYFHQLKSVVTKVQSPLPSKTSFIAYHRLKDWLSLLGFSSETKQGVFFRPPIDNQALLNKLVFMEKIGETYWPFISTSYIFVATKRISTLTPIKSTWQLKPRKIIPNQVPETSQRKTTAISTIKTRVKK